MIHRDDVRRLVREELGKRLVSRFGSEVSIESVEAPRSRAHLHSALLEIYHGPECSEDLDFPIRESCVIEPDRPCYNSGYCKKLGY